MDAHMENPSLRFNDEAKQSLIIPLKNKFRYEIKDQLTVDQLRVLKKSVTFMEVCLAGVGLMGLVEI